MSGRWTGVRRRMYGAVLTRLALGYGLFIAACGASAWPEPPEHSPMSPQAEAAPARRVATSLTDDPLAVPFDVPDQGPAHDPRHHHDHSSGSAAADGGNRATAAEADPGEDPRGAMAAEGEHAHGAAAAAGSAGHHRAGPSESGAAEQHHGSAHTQSRTADSPAADGGGAHDVRQAPPASSGKAQGERRGDAATSKTQAERRGSAAAVDAASRQRGAASAAHGGAHQGPHHGTSEPLADAADGQALYVCPMHPDVQQAQPGKCPRCGMDLVRKKPTAEPQAGPAADGGQPPLPQDVEYECPMHPDVRQAQPGKCPRCGMKLVAKPLAGASQGKRQLTQTEDSAENAGDVSHDVRR
jgi:hypothetical protein